MKKIMLIISLLVFNVNAISTSSYIVYNTNNDSILMGNNIHSPRLIASVSKILTCIIAIENSDINDTVTIDLNTLKTTGSSLYLSLNEKITMRDLLYGLMLRSGNDAAIAIAYHVSGSMESFANLMNEYAKKIGMNDSIFYNSHGLELSNGLGNLSSPYDLALLTKYAMKNPLFREIFQTKKYTCKTNMKTYHWTNKNKLLKYDYVKGGKTGYTLKAKRTLVTTGTVHNQEIVIVTLNDPNDFNDHNDIYNYLIDNYEYYKVLDQDIFLNDLKHFNVVGNYYIKNNYYLFINKKEKDNIEMEYHFNKDNKNGYVNILINKELIHKEPMFLKEKEDNWFKKLLNRFLNFFK